MEENFETKSIWIFLIDGENENMNNAQITVLLQILALGKVAGYDFKCPIQAEWRLRANVACSLENEYVCLFHSLKRIYKEACMQSSLSSIGSKLVFQPFFNLEECNNGKFQPIVFSTNGNSDCIFLKSNCDEEGQAVYSNGSSSRDTTCHCDYTKGYAFVSQPKHRCYCIPSMEDCTCFRVNCSTLSSDYKCITDGEIKENSTCQEIHLQTSIKQRNRTDHSIQNNVQGYFYNAYTAIQAIVVLLAVCGVIIAAMVIVVEKKERKFYQHKIDDDKVRQTIKDLVQRESGKHHFARVVLIGKSGVGKTSLMRRLLWQNKKYCTFQTSTDGIEIEKCNINISNGKWSPCNRMDNDLTRLFHQMVAEKNCYIRKRSDVQHTFDHCPICTKPDEARRESDKEFATDSDESEGTMGSNEGYNCKNYKNYEVFEISTSGTNMPSFEIETIDNNETEERDFNQIQPVDINSPNAYDDRINSNESEGDQVVDEDINQLTSSIMKSFVQRRKEEYDDKLAFCWLWDFAGQKDFYATHQVFLSQCAVFLLVTDSLDFTTAEEPGIDFEDSAQYVRFWFDAIHCYWSTTRKGRLDPPIIVVCTNEDVFKDPLERRKRRKHFQENLSKVLKNQKKKRHLRNVYFVSNTEDDDNAFEEIRNTISQEAMNMKDWGRDCPLKWIFFQQILGKLKESGVPISTTKQLFKIATHNDIGISNNEEFKLCLQYCHDNGTVIYFEEENLEDYVILDPKWLVDAFRCLVSDKIETTIKLSDAWQNLIETGELTDTLITGLFKKEPHLKFFENKMYLLEVMKRFDIIVNLKKSSALYMPCMMKPCTFEDLRKHFIDESQSFYRTSWLCLDFEFLPPAFFNHILAWYIKQYHVSVITENGTRNERKALYRQIGVFDLDLTGCEQLVVCEGPNVIALQVWSSRISDKTYRGLGTHLCTFVDKLLRRYRLKITFTKSFKCKDGDFTFNRQKIHILRSEEYRCLEHKTSHLSEDLVHPWYSSVDIEREIEREWGRQEALKYLDSDSDEDI